jgi:chemotaxis protein methyltransferase CheR
MTATSPSASPKWRAARPAFVRWEDKIVASPLSVEEFRELQEFIYRQSGMYFPLSKRDYLEGKIRKRSEACNIADLRHYLRQLCAGALPAELNQLFNEITINETYFFRDQPQIEALRRHIVPELLNGGRSSLRILSAGCSSGEEPYSLSILLREHFPNLSFSISGIDLSEKVLEMAGRGEYAEYAVRFVYEPLRRKCFELRDGLFRLRNEYRVPVRFYRQNLMEFSGAPPDAPYDIIFCRYVLIYFASEAKRRVIRRFFESLSPGGYLVLGNSESLLSVSEDFRMLHFPSAIIYKRREPNG